MLSTAGNTAALPQLFAIILRFKAEDVARLINGKTFSRPLVENMKGFKAAGQGTGQA